MLSSCNFRGYLVLGNNKFSSINHDWVKNKVTGVEEKKNQRTQRNLDDLFMQMLKFLTRIEREIKRNEKDK